MLEEILHFISKPEIAAALITVVGAGLLKILQPKAKVLWSVNHEFCHGLQQQTQILLLYSKNIFLKNVGKGTADNIEIFFAFKPEHFQIWPPINYSSQIVEGNHFLVRIPHLGKHEHINIELLQTGRETPFVTKLRTIDGECEKINTAPQRIFSTPVYCLILLIMLFGCYQAAKWLWLLAQHLLEG